MRKGEVRLPAIEIVQGAHTIYSFAVDGKEIDSFTTVSRVHRDTENELGGYQRPEVMSHIRAIRRYLESPGAMLPNAIVVAFDSRVRFEPHRRKQSVAYARHGELVIPIDPSLDESDRPAWLVDGQQRSAAIRDADVESFPVAAVGFIARDEDEQREQFILVNSTKPLPSGLIHELLPSTSAELPPKYAKKRLPAYVMIRLNNDHDSPFCGRIRTATGMSGNIKDNSVLKMIENSLYEGALYQYRDPATGDGDLEQMILHLKIYWAVVAATFHDAWLLPPTKSRLTHGVGIESMGFVMDALTEGTLAAELPGLDLEQSLLALLPVTAWTSGSWDLGGGDDRRWNRVQNSPNDIRLVTNHLLRAIRALKSELAKRSRR
jgi:DGQHR domain-containing protein